MTSFFRLLIFLGCNFLFFTSGSSQSLSVKSFGSPSQTDILVGKDNYTVNRLPIVDVHQNSGITVYTHTEADSESNLTGNLNIFCSVYDKDMNVMIPSFRVNFNTGGDQLYPVVKINQNENTFVIAWASNHSADGLYHIYAKKMNFYMINPLAEATNQTDVLISTLNGSRQVMPKLAIDYQWDELIVGWRDMDGAGLAGNDAYARRVNYSDFSTIGNVFLLNERTDDQQVILDLEVSPVTGALYALYHSVYSGSISYEMYYRKFTRDDTGVFIGATEVGANTYTNSLQYNGSLVINETTGDYCINWYSDSQDGNGFGVYFKVYNKEDATICAETRASIPTSGNQLNPRTIWDEASGYLVHFYMYQANNAVLTKYQIFSNTYATVGTEQDATGSVNQNHHLTLNCLAYDQNRKSIFLFYNVSASYGSNPSKAKVRVFDFDHPAQIPMTCAASDLDIAWVQETTFDEFGMVTGESRTYSDKLGRVTQTQTKNIVENKILAQQTVYDVMGRPVISTLPAPIVETCFTYNENFINESSTDTAYSYQHFDAPITSGNVSGEINNPKSVRATTAGTLGWYYSENNTFEPYVPTTLYPYSRVTHNDAISNGVVKASKPGDALRMGLGHEVSAASVPILWELDHYLSLKSHFVNGYPWTQTYQDLLYKGTKSIARDENGRETVSFYDGDGKLLATALSGSTAGNISAQRHSLNITFQANWDISFGVANNQEHLEVYANHDLSKPIYYGKFANAPVGIGKYPIGTVLHFVSKAFFHVVVQSPPAPTNYNACVLNNSIPVGDYIDIHLPAGTQNSLGISGGSVIVYNLETGLQVPYTPGTTILSPGFYRFKATTSTYFNIGYSLNYDNFTYYYYDDAGRMVATVSPKGVDRTSTANPFFVTKYEYNTLDWTLSVTSPDEGKTEYVYRKDGNIKFSRNAEQLNQVHKFSYTNYDEIGRLIEAGEYIRNNAGGDTTLTFQNMKDIYNQVSVSGTSISLILEKIDGIDDEKSTDVSYTKYDIKDAGLSSLISGYSQSFVNSNVSYTYKKSLGTDANAISKTWYSYDEMGLLKWMIQSINGLGIKTTDYEYDLNGNVKKVIYQKNISSERLDHIYTYDKMERLKRVDTRLSLGPMVEQAEYFYYLHGPLKRKEIAGDLQGLDYTYTIDGNLKAINHPYLDANDPGGDSYPGIHNSFKKDIFGMMLEYYDNDYLRNTKFLTTTNLSSLTYEQFYNGNIRSNTWNTQPSTSATTPVQYAFGYDKKYQLTRAVFGDHNTSTKAFTASVNNKYKLDHTFYDDNGNIKMQRKYNENGAYNTANSMNYSYATNKNQLQYTTQQGLLSYEPNREFIYDSIGRMIESTSNVAGELNKYVMYDVCGLVTAVYANAAKTQPRAIFVYDERGQRIKKTSYSTSTWIAQTHTWYVRDASGNVLSIYETNVSTAVTAQKELPIYGGSRIGIVNKYASADYNYEINDHLGNVRATIRKVSGNLEVLSWADYYPYGSVMPGRNATSSPAYRNGYQGEFAEKDVETGWDAFELRMYDANLGRWFAPDPYGQYHSPYVGMGNNPVNMIDPDGGLALESIADGAYRGAMNVLSAAGKYNLLTLSEIAVGASSSNQWKKIVSVIVNNLPTEYDFPVWGACVQSNDALNRGDYLAAGGWFLAGTFEMFTLGIGTEIKTGITAVNVTTKAANAGANTAAKAGGQGVNRIYSARELVRRAAEPGPFHNFPESFNKAIFQNGTKTITPNYFNVAKPGLSNTNILYRYPGTINGTKGFYELGVRPSLSGRTEVIMHRFFNPIR